MNQPNGLVGRACVLVADDHPFLRDGVKQFFNQLEDLEICGEAGDIHEVLAKVETASPNLILLDLQLGNGDVLELIKSLRARFKDLKILIFSAHDECLFAERSLRAGAHGYIAKHEPPTEVAQAVRRVLRGELYVSRRVAVALLGKLLASAPPDVPANRVEGLSDREFQVFRMLGAGLPNREISRQLGLSVKTIETYRENIKHKFGLRTAAELIRRATQWAESTAGQNLTRSGIDPAGPAA
jgi:DNA-binding NarL/FixJ family response regulator